MTNYRLHSLSFSYPNQVTEFVNSQNLTPRQIQDIVFQTNPQEYVLFYWLKDEKDKTRII